MTHLDDSPIVGALLNNLSKAFDSALHNLIIAKQAYDLKISTHVF